MWPYLLSNFVLDSYSILVHVLRSRSLGNLTFTIGFFIMLLGAMVNIFREIFPLPVNFWTENSCMLSLSIEVFFTGSAMALNINELLMDRETLLIEKSNYGNELLKTEMNAEENERRRIAEDLHDDLGILLTSTKLEASNENNKEKIIDLVDKSILKIRQITQKLHPSVVDQFELIPVLEDFFENMVMTVPF
ncbi:MAG: hypothetical protein ACKVOU_10395 [Cytophagales bacterium]